MANEEMHKQIHHIYTYIHTYIHTYTYKNLHTCMRMYPSSSGSHVFWTAVLLSESFRFGDFGLLARKTRPSAKAIPRGVARKLQRSTKVKSGAAAAAAAPAAAFMQGVLFHAVGERRFFLPWVRAKGNQMLF